MPTMPTDILPGFFRRRATRRCPAAAAEQCDDLMGVTNDLSGQRTEERTDDFFCPLLSDRGGDVALNACTF